MYHIQFNTPAEKYLKKLKDKVLKNKFKETIHKISQNPYEGKPKTGDLAGIYSWDMYHSGVNYEIAYEVYKNDIIVFIYLISTRENFYKELKRIL